MPSKKDKFKNLFPNMRPKLMAIPGGPRVHAPTDMLGPDHFKIAIFIALAFHVVLFGVWSLLPKPEVIEVPVHTLSIKLSDQNDAALSAEELQALAPDGANKSDVEATLAHLVRDPSVDAARADSVTGTMEKAMGAAKNIEDEELKKHATFDALKQFVRTPVTQAKDSAESAGQKEVVARYETLVSMWVQKFKITPPEAKTAKVGETLLRLQIDRQGNIRNFVLEGSTGNAVLDHAAIDMVRRANPVPAVPNDYPAGELFEFVVPVQFDAQ
jgi:TonB family protein